MSKLRTRIRDAARARGGNIGFSIHREAAARHSYVLVVAEVDSAGAASAAVDAGAHALLYRGDGSGLADVVRAAGPLAVGLRADAATRADADAAVDAGADFIAFDPDRASAAALLRRNLGRVLLLGEGERSDDELRALGMLDLDAVVLRGAAAEMTVRDQLGLRRVAGHARAPLAVANGDAPETAALEVWRDAGVLLVLVDGDAETVRRAVSAALEVPAPEPERESADPMVPSAGRFGL